MECQLREFRYGMLSDLSLSGAEARELSEVTGEDPKCNIVFP